MIEHYSTIVTRYAAQLPNLADTFEIVASMPPADRIDWALKQRAYIFRDGWFVNTPVAGKGDAETVQQHVSHLVDLIDDYFPDKQKDTAKAYAECHDDQETIAHAVIGGVKRDLNPRFNQNSYQISEQDKEIIEATAVDLLFEADPARKKLWHAYKDVQSDVAQRFNSLDKVCVMWRCVDFVKSGKYAYNDFQAYWDYWTPERATQKLHPAISDLYIQQCQSQANSLRL